MCLDSRFEPPISVCIVEVIQVACTRGSGADLRNVTQLWTKAGHLIAEHDHIHDDPIYASLFLRDALTKSAALVSTQTAGQGT